MLGMDQALTHKQSLETFKLEEIGGIEYIAVYLDTDGNRHYSSEEFKAGQEGIFSVDDAFEEIARLTLKNNWQFLRLLAVSHGKTDFMNIRLEVLQKAREVIAEFVGDYSNMGSDETQEVAAEILAGERVMGRIRD